MFFSVSFVTAYEPNTALNTQLNTSVWMSLSMDEDPAPASLNDATGTFTLSKTGTVTSDADSIINKSFYFDGSNDYYRDPVGFQLGNIASGSFSGSLWVKNALEQGTGEDFVFMNYGSTTDKQWGLYYDDISGGDRICFYLDFYAQEEVCSSVFNEQEWHHIAFIYNQTTNSRALYIDGVLDENYTDSTNYGGTSSEFVIGANTDLSDDFNGYVDEFTIWNKVLTQQEVVEIYNRQNDNTSGAQYPFQAEQADVLIFSPSNNKHINSNQLEVIFNTTVTDGTCYLYVNGSNTCYQETANETSACGGLATGSYSLDSDWSSGGSNTYDGNYSTLDSATGPASATATLNITYDKIPGYGGMIWRTKDGNSEQNISILDSCFDQSEVLLRVDSVNSIPDRVDYYCYNGSWQLLLSNSGSMNFYEEGIYHLLDASVPTAPGNLTINSTNLTDGDYNFYVNCLNSTVSYNSSVRNFTIDTSKPFIVDNSGLDNTTVINSYSNLNVTVGPDYLFRVEVNATCDSGNNIYSAGYDYNGSLQSATLTDAIPNLQCDVGENITIFIEAADTHTARKIKKIKHDIYNKELIFNDKNKVRVYPKDRLRFRDPTTKKLFDRHTFKYEKIDKKRNNLGYETFYVEGENWKIVEEGKYKNLGHLANWETKQWLDFNTEQNYPVVINQQSPTKYEVKVYCGDCTEDLEFQSIGGLNVNNLTINYNFLGVSINVTTKNVYDSKVINNTNVTLQSINTYSPFSGTFNFDGAINLTNISNGTYQLSFVNPQFFPKTVTVNAQNNSVPANFTSYQSLVHILPSNIKTGNIITAYNITVTNNDTAVSETKTNQNTTTDWYLNAGTYTYMINASGYDELNGSFTVTYQQELTIDAAMSFLATFRLFDERTEEAFNISSPDKITFFLFCPNGTFTTEINTTNATIPIECDYLKFKFVLDYGATNYFRSFIIPPEDALDYNIYLIDLATTQYVFNNLIIDDLLDNYDNPSIYVKKTIGNETPVITADFIDVENKVSAYLMENNEYILEIHSDNNPVRILGNYIAAESGDKNLRLYEVTLDTPLGLFNPNVTYNMGKFSIAGTNDTYILAEYEDLNNQTNNVTFIIYRDTYGGSILYSSTTTSNQVEWQFNMTPYENLTLYGDILIDHSQDGQQKFSKLLNEFSEINLPMKQHLGDTESEQQQFLNWFFTLFLSVIAIMATISTADHVALVLVGIAILFSVFGWFVVGNGILGLCLLISLISLLKKGDKRMSNRVT